MCNDEGNLLDLSIVEDKFHAQLSKVQSTHPHLIVPDLDILEEYGIARSLRRGLVSRAMDQNVSKEIRDLTLTQPSKQIPGKN
eukprot:9108408-Ditylum_brightwellii.AAC.1